MMLSKKSVSVCLLFTLFVFAGFGCKQELASFETPLEIWGVFDTEGDYREVFDAYEEAHPFISRLSYRKFTIDTYRQELLNALASGNGPDVFMIHNSWLPDFADKVAVAPQGVVDPQMVRSQLVDVGAFDMVFDEKVFALAPSVDSLALYYNKDIFNGAGITSPPTTWEEFDEIVKVDGITRIEDGRILQSGAAMGTARNVSRQSDILIALMMQGGVEMSRDDDIRFHQAVPSGDDFALPGRNALQYYTSFADGNAPVYTWNNSLHHSIDSFYEGTTAMTISYSYSYDTIKAKNEKLNFGVVPLPQIDAETFGRQANYANYWMYVVAKNRTVPPKGKDDKYQITNDMKIWESWQFLKALNLNVGSDVAMVSPLDGSVHNITLPFDLTLKYLETTKKPAARRDIIEQQKNDERLGPFARGNLIARSWVRKNAEAIDQVLYDIIDDVNRGQNVVKALELGAQRAQQLMK